MNLKNINYQVFGFDCRFAQYVNEWAIPIEHTVEAMKKLKHFIDSSKFKVIFST